MGEEKCRSQKKKNEISMGEEKCKSQEKKKRMKYESSLEYCEKKKKMIQSCLEWRKGPTWIFGLCIMCFGKSFEKLFCMNLIMSLNSMKSLELL